MGRRYFWTLLTPRLNGSSELCFQLTKLTENYIGIISKFCIALHCLIFYILAFHRALIYVIALSHCRLSQCWRYRVVTLSHCRNVDVIALSHCRLSQCWSIVTLAQLCAIWSKPAWPVAAEFMFCLAKFIAVMPEPPSLILIAKNGIFLNKTILKKTEKVV